MLILILLTLLVEFGMPLVIIYVVVKALKNAQKSNSTKRSTLNRDANQYRCDYDSELLNNQSKIRPAINSTNFDKRLMTNDELQQRRETRDAFLKAKFEEAAEKEDEIENDIEPMVEQQRFLDIPATSFDIAPSSELDSVLNSEFDLQSDDRFAPKFDTSFDYDFGSKDIEMRNDVNKSGNDESFVDSLLREYGVEKKKYEWEV